jgi:hypothetical protein
VCVCVCVCIYIYNVTCDLQINGWGQPFIAQCKVAPAHVGAGEESKDILFLSVSNVGVYMFSMCVL